MPAIVITMLALFTYIQFIYVGIVTSLQFNNKEVDTARKGEEVCVKIDSVPGEAPKMFGRHFDETVGGNPYAAAMYIMSS